MKTTPVKLFSVTMALRERDSYATTPAYRTAGFWQSLLLSGSDGFERPVNRTGSPQNLSFVLSYKVLLKKKYLDSKTYGGIVSVITNSL